VQTARSACKLKFAGRPGQSFKLRVLTLGTNLELYSVVLGRITENDLNEAEKSFPGIIEIYEGLKTKPLTFLQLVYLYEVAVVG
jgi:hypothetical protein